MILGSFVLAVATSLVIKAAHQMAAFDNPEEDRPDHFSTCPAL
jgi:hypothetical protein